MSDRPYRQAVPDIPCVDVLRNEQIMDPDVRGAYSALAGRGEIHIDRIVYKKRDGIAVIEYRSTMPKDWTRDALRREKKQIKEGERDAD